MLPADRSGALLPLESLIAGYSGAVSQMEQYMEHEANTSLGIIPSTPRSVESKIFVRSEYAEVEHMQVSKQYYTTGSGKLLPGDAIRAVIAIKNNTGSIRHAEYLDTVPAIFSLDTASKYRVTIGDASKELPIQRESYGDFDLRFLIGDIPARATIQIEYHLTVLPVSYGEMKVGDFEVKTPGHDRYGDILFHTSTTCGADAMKWLSTDARAYKKESGMPAIVPASFPLPEGLRDRLNDANQNGIPDSIENPSSQELQDEYRNMTQLPAELNRDILQVTRNGNTSVTIGFDSQTVARIEEIASDIFNGLACGFGGGSCLSFPINWAPLAPGNDPVLFGIPIGDGFHPLEGLPIFSAVTTKPCFSGVCPSTWPPSPWGA